MLRIIPTNGQTWLICGGRDFANETMFDFMMGQLIARYGCPVQVLHGAASGVDTMAGKWAKGMGVDVVAFPADWNQFGKSAGPRRNADMIRRKPAMVVAFPGGRGTADLVAKAREAGITVAEINEK